MQLFNIISGVCSILGLLFSVVIFLATNKIQKKITITHKKEDFNLQRDSMFDKIRASGINAVRTDIPDSDYMYEFQRDLMEYSKQYQLIFTTEEKKHIENLLELTKNPCPQSEDWVRSFRFLLNQVTTKPLTSD